MLPVVESGLMLLYSLVLAAILIFGSPYWLLRMATTHRYRAGLRERLGRVPADLKAAVAGKQAIWLHAVSVGEVLAATRLVKELEEALGPKWIIVISTTTATGHALARKRFQPERYNSEGNPQPARVFWYPLDFAWSVRGHLRALQPRLLVLMESELWPRMLSECRRARIPVAVVNSRVSDRSFARGKKLRPVWGWVLRQVSQFLTQSEQDAERLLAMGASPLSVQVTGNLKYGVRPPGQSRIAELIQQFAAGRPIVIAGSTVAAKDNIEERLILEAWSEVLHAVPQALLVIAPRHPERFNLVYSMAQKFGVVRASELEVNLASPHPAYGAILLNTIGDLAAVYAIADAAFVGGSLVQRGGHNPLEPAQFAVPVVMGSSYENFRDVVGAMLAADAIRIVAGKDELARTLIELLANPAAARALGQRGSLVYEQEQEATTRTVTALLRLVPR